MILLTKNGEKMNKAVKEATQIVESRMAKLITDYEYQGYFHGHYEGLGFKTESICPDHSCLYYKYAGIGFSPVCTHPRVALSVKIGGVNKCPKSTEEKWAVWFITKLTHKKGGIK